TACCSGDKTSSRNQSDMGMGFNTVDRQYAKNTPDTWAAAHSTMKSFGLTIDSDRHDTMGGELKAHRASGDKVLVRVQSLDEKTTDVSVRVEPGIRNLAEMIHERMADKLGIKEAKAVLFGGNTCEGTYPTSLENCVKAAEDAARRLNLTVTNKEIKDGAAIVDAREANSNPVQFNMKRTGDHTKVTFIAGREKTDVTRDLANRMKAEFEAATSAGSN